MRFLILAAMLTVLAAAPARAGEFDTNAKLCTDASTGPGRRIAACTWLLNSGKLAQKFLAVVYNNRGVANAAKGAFERAIGDYDQAIARKPDYAAAYNNRGSAYTNIVAYDSAIRDYDRAIALKPDFAFAYYNRAVAYKNNGAYDRAIRDYGRTIDLMPKYVVAYANRGNAHKYNGAYERAIRDYDRVIDLKPDGVIAYLNRGLAYAKQGRAGAAKQDFDTAFRLKSGDAAFFNAIGWFLATQVSDNNRDGDAAVRFATEAVRLDDSAARHHGTLAAAHAEAGQFAQAVTAQQSAIDRLRAAGRDGAVANLQSRLERYRAGRPYRAR